VTSDDFLLEIISHPPLPGPLRPEVTKVGVYSDDLASLRKNHTITILEGSRWSELLLRKAQSVRYPDSFGSFSLQLYYKNQQQTNFKL